MTVREYKELHNLTLKALVDEFQQVDPRVDMPLVSKMVNGICGPSEVLQAYIDEMPERVFANSPHGLFDGPDSTFLEKLYMAIEAHSIAYPATREYLRVYTGRSDRQVRMGIEELRNRGARIISQSGRYGYWLDSKGGGYDTMRNEMRSKAFSILRTLGRMNQELEGQVRWDAEHGLTVASGTTPGN